MRVVLHRLPYHKHGPSPCSAACDVIAGFLRSVLLLLLLLIHRAAPVENFFLFFFSFCLVAFFLFSMEDNFTVFWAPPELKKRDSSRLGWVRLRLLMLAAPQLYKTLTYTFVYTTLRSNGVFFLLLFLSSFYYYLLLVFSLTLLSRTLLDQGSNRVPLTAVCCVCVCTCARVLVHADDSARRVGLAVGFCGDAILHLFIFFFVCLTAADELTFHFLFFFWMSFPKRDIDAYIFFLLLERKDC